MKKSARAYGSTTAWNDASDSCSSSGDPGLTSLCPAEPRKSPITAMSGLKTFDPAPTAAPYTGSASDGPPAPSAPGGICAVGCVGVGCAVVAAWATVGGAAGV